MNGLEDLKKYVDAFEGEEREVVELLIRCAQEIIS